MFSVWCEQHPRRISMSSNDYLQKIAQAVQIRPFQARDQDSVKMLILVGLKEHWGTLDTSLNPDLNDVAAAYGTETFLVAVQNGRIVGTGALIHEVDDISRIVRMSVDPKLRRMGIGRQLLAALCDAAKKRSYRQIVLETTSNWDDAIRFYLAHGFQIVEYRDGDTHFLLNLERRD